MTVETPSSPPRRRRWRLRVPILSVLVLGVGGLVAAAVLTVLLIGLGSSRHNTYDLLSDKADLAMNAIEQQIRLHLEPARHQGEFIARLVAGGELDLANSSQVADMLFASQAATPEVNSLFVVDPNAQALRVTRSGTTQLLYLGNDAAVRERIDEASRTKQPFWGDVLWTQELGSFVNLRTPLWHEGRFVGVLVSAVQVGNLSRMLLTIPGDLTGRAFVLRGREEVLAHPSLAGLRANATDERRPLPLLAQIGDPVLARIWDAKRVTIEPLVKGSTQGHLIEADDNRHVFLTRELAGFGPTPWLIGVHVDLETVERELRRLLEASLAGAAVLVVALLAASGLARLLGRPILSLARSAEAVRSLDIPAAQPLSRSLIRELDEAGRAFNQMLTGLRWFETYVPRGLVRHLIARGTLAVTSSERRVTVMFTDIRGFTSLSERLSAAEVAALLNDHLALIERCVEKEQGIFDKYIGDSVMVFWGAPLIEVDHAARAIRTARAIAAAIAADNRRRAAAGAAIVRIAIGLHTGPAIVGNIGPPGRVNYTIVGDTVNTATRILGEAKDIESGADAVVLASGETVRAAGREAEGSTSLGPRQLRGRKEAIDVFRLV
jgi:class 3 adenylate cyclase